MSGNLEDEVRAFDVDDSSSGKPFRPSSGSGSRYERRGGGSFGGGSVGQGL